MTTEQTVSAPEVVVEKTRKQRAKMEDGRKNDHHAAKDKLVAFLKANPDLNAKWTNLPPFAGKQIRVLANFLLDYVPGFLTFIDGAVDTSPQVVECDALLTSINDLAAYRKTNVPIWKRGN